MSGIYINGIEMPTKGYRLILVHADGTVQTTGGETTAVPVPDHGRLGDLDKLYKKMERYSDNEGATGYQDDTLIHRDSVLFAIEDVPTIIPAEESIHECFWDEEYAEAKGFTNL